MMKVTEPIDYAEMGYALEHIIIEARKNDVDEHELKNQLEAILRAVENGDL